MIDFKKHIDRSHSDVGIDWASNRIGRYEAWDVGLYAEEVTLRGRQVWARDQGEKRFTLRGELAEALTIDEFWEECREGLAK